MKKILCLFVTLVMSMNCLGNQNTGPVKIISIGNWVGTPNNPDETLYINTDQTSLTNPANCSKTNAYKLLDSSDINKTMLISAYMANKSVVLNIGGTCNGDYPNVVQVVLTE